jgi:hypothetical protein
MRSWLFAGVGALSALLMTMGAQAAELNAGYMVGKWTSGGKPACSAPASEVSEFRADGTFATRAKDRVVATGFWTLDEDRLDMQLLAHDTTHPALEAIEGDYAYFVIRSLIFDVEDDSYRQVQVIGDHLQGVKAYRCP